MLSIRDLQPSDIPKIVDYFHDADDAFLIGMGADRSKMPRKADWIKLIAEESGKPLDERRFFYLIWCYEGRAIGHSSLSDIEFGVRAKMHLHIWDRTLRRQGYGSSYLKMTIPQYFDRFQLKELICEPYAHNPGPNRTLVGLGFELVDTYETVPGWINTSQEVNRYFMRSEQFQEQVWID